MTTWRKRRRAVEAGAAAFASVGLFGAAFALGTLAEACASDEERDGHAGTDAMVVSGPADAESDADATVADLDAGPCADCEFYPDACSADALCPNGPFDADTTGGAIDGRTRIAALRGRSSNDVWAIGALGALAHFDGTRWTRTDLGVRESMRALWLREGSEVALSSFIQVFARNSEIHDAGIESTPIVDGWAEYRTKRYSDDFATAKSALQFVSAWGAPDAAWVWCTTLNSEAQFVTAPGLWRMRVTEAKDGFEVGNAVPVDACNTSVPCGQMTAVHGISADDLWAVGQSGATIHVTGADGDAPHLDAFNSQTSKAFRGVWASSDREAWSVGDVGVVRHWSGDAYLWDVVTGVPVSSPLNAVWASSATDVWVVGDGAIVLHYDGTSWSRVKIAGLGVRRPDLTAVWGSGPGHVWIAGDGFVLSLGGTP